MATLVTRSTAQTDGTAAKGSELTHAEVDANFINLNDDKIEAASTHTLTNKSGNISQWTNDSNYLTSESDTLATVTGRGATTSTSITIGGLHVNATTAVEMPAGTDAQRPTAVTGMLRFNTTSTTFEGYDGSAWGAIGGGGGATEGVFYENDQTLSTNVTIAATKNAMATGPVAISSGVSVTVSNGARVVIL